jgi:hypothetical protein
MRAELKTIHMDIPPVGEDDLDYMFDLAVRLAKSHIRASQDDIAALVAKGQHELVDDEVWYTHLDTLYLCEYLIWRLQGIFERLITTTFLPQDPDLRLRGLRAKLYAIRDLGYTLSDQDEEELLAWANLRNVLSHAPPGGYAPLQLCESDLLEYKGLLKGMCKHWRTEREGILSALN